MTDQNKTSILKFMLNMRLHIGLLFAYPFFLWGLLIALSFNNWNFSLLTQSLDRVAYVAIISLTYLPFIFVANDVIDAPFDALDAGKKQRNYFCTHKLSDNWLITFTTLVLPILCSLVCSWLLGLEIFVISLFVFAIGFFYSASPLRLKEVPIADFSSHGLYVSSYFFFIGADAIYPFVNWITQPLFLILLLLSWTDGAWLHFQSQVADYKTDLEGKQRTTAVWIGEENSVKFFKLLQMCLYLCLPLYIIFNPKFTEIFSIIGVLILVLFSLGLLLWYVWYTKGGAAAKDQILKRSFKARGIFMYPFALISIIFMNPALHF